MRNIKNINKIVFADGGLTIIPLTDKLVVITTVCLDKRGNVLCMEYPFVRLPMDTHHLMMSECSTNEHLKVKVSDGNTLVTLMGDIPTRTIRYEVRNTEEYHLLEYINDGKTLNTQEIHRVFN